MKRASRLSAIGAGLSGHVLVVSVRPLRSGVVTLTGTVGGRRLGTCRAQLPARERFACRMLLGRHRDMRGLTIVARLTDRGKLLARRTRVGPP